MALPAPDSTRKRPGQSLKWEKKDRPKGKTAQGRGASDPNVVGKGKAAGEGVLAGPAGRGTARGGAPSPGTGPSAPSVLPWSSRRADGGSENAAALT